jgi:hypothetical protein
MRLLRWLWRKHLWPTGSTESPQALTARAMGSGELFFLGRYRLGANKCCLPPCTKSKMMEKPSTQTVGTEMSRTLGSSGSSGTWSFWSNTNTLIWEPINSFLGKTLGSYHLQIKATWHTSSLRVQYQWPVKETLDLDEARDLTQEPGKFPRPVA